MQQMTYPFVFKSNKKLTDNWMNEMQPPVFENGRFLFQDKSDHLHILVILVYKVNNARIFARSFVLDRRSADKNLLIENMMEQIKKVVQRRKKSSLFSGTTLTNTHFLTIALFEVPFGGTNHNIGQLSVILQVGN